MDIPLLIVAKSRKVPGPVVQISCPRCRAARVPATPYRQLDDLCLFHFVRLFTLKNTFVYCSACGATLHSSVDLDELARYRHGELDQFLSYDVSFVVKFLAIASLLLCMAPGVGLILSLLTVLLTLKTPGWPRTLGRAGLALSGLATLFFLGMIVLGH